MPAALNLNESAFEEIPTMNDSTTDSKLDRFAQITKTASSISIILGIGVALFGAFNAMEEMRVAVRTMKLSTLSAHYKYIEDDAKARTEIDHFLASYDSDALVKLIAKYGTGEKAYDSPELSELRDIGHHYELIATLVKLNYVDFDLVYETIPFPDSWWKTTEAFRTEIQTKNWWSQGKGLPDFWGNLEYLKKRYDKKRAKE
jgi:hypothetical protein